MEYERISNPIKFSEYSTVISLLYIINPHISISSIIELLNTSIPMDFFSSLSLMLSGDFGSALQLAKYARYTHKPSRQSSFREVSLKDSFAVTGRKRTSTATTASSGEDKIEVAEQK